jgi:glutaredoxin
LMAGLALVGTFACSRKKDDDGTTPRPKGGELPSLKLRDDTPNLMLTWIDQKGETHVELHPPDVPAEGRALVRVVVADREDGTRDLFYVVDLSQKGPEDAYAARTMSRRDWESQIEERRKAYLASIAPPPPAGGTTAPSPPGSQPAPSGLTVIIYGADWCKPCHQAASHLRSRGVPYVEKDVERSEDAAREMQAKLERIGRRGGTIPVIDVRGEILVGYSQGDLDRALKKAASGTVL